MDRFALFIDGGYLAAAAAHAVAGMPKRHLVRLDLLQTRERGVRVHLVVASAADASWTLRQEADTVTVLMPAQLATFASPARPVGPP